MSLVAADPARLERFTGELLPRDARLLTRARELRGVLDRHQRTNAAVAGDHRALADALEELATVALTLDREVGELGGAIAAADRLHGPSGAPTLTAADVDRWRRDLRAATDGSTGDLRAALLPLDPTTWRTLVYGQVTCPDGWAGHYRGSGAVLGPDGRRYPLVIPELAVDGRTIHVSLGTDPARDAATLGGTDPGWQTVTVVTGSTRIADPPRPAARAAVAAGLTAGLSTPTLTYATPEQLATLGLERWGMPLAGGVPPPPRQGPPRPVGPSEPGSQTVRATPAPGAPVRPIPRHRRTVTSAGRTGAAIDLATGAAEAVVTTRSLDDGNHAAYQLRFEVTDDGRRRAQLLLYQAIAGDGLWAVVPSAGYVDADGTLQRTPARYDLDGPSIGPAGAIPAAPTILLDDQPTRGVGPPTG